MSLTRSLVGTLITTEDYRGFFLNSFLAVGKILVVVQGLAVGGREGAEVALETLDVVAAQVVSLLLVPAQQTYVHEGLVTVLTLEILPDLVNSLDVDVHARAVRGRVIAVGTLFLFIMDFGHVPRQGLLVYRSEGTLVACVALHACLTIQ